MQFKNSYHNPVQNLETPLIHCLIPLCARLETTRLKRPSINDNMAFDREGVKQLCDGNTYIIFVSEEMNMSLAWNLLFRLTCNKARPVAVALLFGPYEGTLWVFCVLQVIFLV